MLLVMGFRWAADSEYQRRRFIGAFWKAESRLKTVGGGGLTNQGSAATIKGLHLCDEWACGAAGSALPWHGRGHRFDPDQVHQLSSPPWCQLVSILVSILG